MWSPYLVAPPEGGGEGGGGGGGGLETDTDAVPVMPSPRATTVVAPGATAVTVPAGDIVAIVGLDEDQVIGRPLRTPPPESLAVATKVAVSPGWRCTSAGAIVREATDVSAITILALPHTLPMVALIVAVPSPVPVTMPLLDTVAIEEGEMLSQITSGFAIECPSLVFAEGRSCRD